MNDHFLDHREVLIKTRISRRTVLHQRTDGSFPHLPQISENKIGWPASEITDWMASRPSAAR